VGVTQFLGQHAQPGVGPDRGAGGHQRQRQREVGAAGDDLPDRRRLGRDPVRAQALGQELVRFVVGEQVQRDRMGTVAGDQAGELVAAGHHHQTAGRTGQQRADLRGVASVVQQHQHPLTGKLAAIHRRLGVQIDRDPFRWDL